MESTSETPDELRTNPKQTDRKQGRADDDGSSGGGDDSSSSSIVAGGLSMLLPAFIQQLMDPSIRTVLVCGCGGGFDFVHSMNLYPELIRLGKQVVIASYSFGCPLSIKGGTEVYRAGKAVAKRVDATCKGDKHYCPETGMLAFLDETFPSGTPHSLYALYARNFSVPQLRAFYEQLCVEHDINAVVVFDGGSDSLMVGDEQGLGDPIEDAVTVQAVASMTSPSLHGPRTLISVGFGADRFNHVSDAASLRAVAELTAAGAFLGSISLDSHSHGFKMYRACVDKIYSQSTFRSVLVGMVIASAEGFYGGTVPPKESGISLGGRVKAGDAYIWPLMSMMWAFDCRAVARRSLVCRWIAALETVEECHDVVATERRALHAKAQVRPVENVPRHEDLRMGGPGVPNEDGVFRRHDKAQCLTM